MSTLREQWAALPDGKLCSTCHIVRPKTDFHKNKSGKEGLQAQCRFCTGERVKAYYKDHREHTTARKKQWRDKNRARLLDYNKNDHLRRKYGMSLADKLRMHANQDGRCKCCGDAFVDDPRKWYIDHNHETKKVRGLLCHYCNTGIGMLGDDVPSLRKALTYLEENDG